MNARAALVTGGARRLGRAMALRLADRGAAVAVHFATSREAGAETVDQIREAGGEAVAVEADLLDEVACSRLVERAAECLGRPLDVLVNNASIFEHDTLASASEDSWQRHMMSNFRAPFILIQGFARQAPEPVPVPERHGELTARSTIINLVDQRVLKPTPQFMTYTLAKLGLWNLTGLAARALAPGIRVNAIGPGPTLQGHRQSDDHFRKQRAATPLERGAGAEDVVAAMDFLLDSPSVTGQLICPDGGQHLAWQTPDALVGRG